MRKAIVIAVVALALPSVALAGAPTTHTNHSKAAPRVMYVLKGTLSNFVAASATADGSISITVSHANRHGKKLTKLDGDTLTFAVASNTRITFANGTTALPDGAKGMVKFRAPMLRGASEATLAATLPSTAKAFHIIVTQAAS
ncbi:MAG: hypothetical protein ACJ75G_08695 [Gaiellaceae bacterium]|jgi:hypothetical protein